MKTNDTITLGSLSGGGGIRDASGDFYRCLLMFGICMCHSVSACEYRSDALRNIFMMCVVGFVFITGWYGVRFSLMKLARLLGVAAFAVWVVRLTGYFFLDGWVDPKSFPKALNQWWFLSSYCKFLVLTPFCNCLCEGTLNGNKKVRRDAFLGIAMLVAAVHFLGWAITRGWAPSLEEHTLAYFASPCSYVTMASVYCVARIIKLHNLYQRVSVKLMGVLFVLSCVLAALSFDLSQYNSPIALLFAITSFYIVQKIPLSRGVQRTALFLAPFMFSVYLFHSLKEPGFKIMNNLQGWMMAHSVPGPVTWLLIGLIVFCFGCLVDMPRHYACKYISKVLAKL